MRGAGVVDTPSMAHVGSVDKLSMNPGNRVLTYRWSGIPKCFFKMTLCSDLY